MQSVRFKVGQRFASKSDPELSAEVVQCLERGQEAFLHLYKKDDLFRSQPVKYSEFLDYWTLLPDRGGQ